MRHRGWCPRSARVNGQCLCGFPPPLVSDLRIILNDPDTGLFPLRREHCGWLLDEVERLQAKLTSTERSGPSV